MPSMFSRFFRNNKDNTQKKDDTQKQNLTKQRFSGPDEYKILNKKKKKDNIFKNKKQCLIQIQQIYLL